MSILIGTPYTRGAGYFLNNKAEPQKNRQEADIQTCPHCQGVIKMQEWKHDGGWCSKCMRPLCNNPTCIQETALYGCVPFTKKIEQYAEQQMRFAKIARK